MTGDHIDDRDAPMPSAVLADIARMWGPDAGLTPARIEGIARYEAAARL
jgi:hypothetical protein